MPTRREFLVGCAALAVSASVKPVLASGGPFLRRDLSLEEISFRDFAIHVNTPFLVSQESGTVAALQLVQARLFGDPTFAPTSSAEDARNEKFSLLFVGDERAVLQSATYDFEHERIGQFQMFISPVGQNQPGLTRYQAVFNRPAPGPNHAAVAEVGEFRR
jgi:hypothetical protein